MSQRERGNIGIGLLIASLLLAMLAWIGYQFFSEEWTSQESEGQMPPALKQSGILLGEDLFSKKELWSDPTIGLITDIRFSQLDGKPGEDIGIAGLKTAFLLNESGRVKDTIKFDEECIKISIVDVEGDGVCEFFDAGGSGFYASLLDHQGNTLWWYDEVDSDEDIEDSAVGDLNEDGKLDFAVLFGGEKGIHLLDCNGNVLWKQETVYQSTDQIDVVKLSEDNGLGLLYSAFGDMVLLDKKGALVKQTELGGLFAHIYFGDFSICRSPNGTDQIVIIAAKKFVQVINLAGRTVAHLSTQWSCDFGKPFSTLVLGADGKSEYLAILVEFQRWNRSVLAIYDEELIPIYEEVIPDNCEVITSRPYNNSKATSILVGGDGKVWEYRLAENK